MLRSALLVSLSFAAALSAQSNPFRAAAIFGDHMVLPAETSAPFRGETASEDEKLDAEEWEAGKKRSDGTLDRRELGCQLAMDSPSWRIREGSDGQCWWRLTVSSE